jgi:hypothetical protein
MIAGWPIDRLFYILYLVLDGKCNVFLHCWKGFFEVWLAIVYLREDSYKFAVILFQCPISFYHIVKLVLCINEVPMAFLAWNSLSTLPKLVLLWILSSSNHIFANLFSFWLAVPREIIVFDDLLDLGMVRIALKDLSNILLIICSCFYQLLS